MRISIFLLVLGFFTAQVEAQKDVTVLSSDPSLSKSQIDFIIHSKYAPFPDSARMNGHDYNGQHYKYEGHYDDSSVQIHLPIHFTAKKPIELLVWFHGWYNNIDSAGGFGLTQQFDAADRNAIFIFPEGPVNAPDSYGGKLERPEMFKLFINDVLNKLKRQNILPKNKNYSINDCSITLAGHSGAYRVISKIIQYNKVDELLLFDAMYGGNEAYLKWIAESKKHRFIHIYTKDGGTLENTNLIMQNLKDSLHVDIQSVSENELKKEDLNSGKPLFIFSESDHNWVITWNSNLYRFLHHWKLKEPWLESRIITEDIRKLMYLKN